MTLPSYMTVTEAAAALGVSRERVHDWIKRGKLPVAARSEYAGFLLSRRAVEGVGRTLAEEATVRSGSCSRQGRPPVAG